MDITYLQNLKKQEAGSGVVSPERGLYRKDSRMDLHLTGKIDRVRHRWYNICNISGSVEVIYETIIHNR